MRRGRGPQGRQHTGSRAGKGTTQVSRVSAQRCLAPQPPARPCVLPKPAPELGRVAGLRHVVVPHANLALLGATLCRGGTKRWRIRGKRAASCAACRVLAHTPPLRAFLSCPAAPAAPLSSGSPSSRSLKAPVVIMLRPHSATRPRPARTSAAPRSVSGAGAAPFASPAGLGAGGGGNCTLPTSTPNCRRVGTHGAAPKSRQHLERRQQACLLSCTNNPSAFRWRERWPKPPPPQPRAHPGCCSHLAHSLQDELDLLVEGALLGKVLCFPGEGLWLALGRGRRGARRHRRCCRSGGGARGRHSSALLAARCGRCGAGRRPPAQAGALHPRHHDGGGLQVGQDSDTQRAAAVHRLDDRVHGLALAHACHQAGGVKLCRGRHTRGWRSHAAFTALGCCGTRTCSGELPLLLSTRQPSHSTLQ